MDCSGLKEKEGWVGGDCGRTSGMHSQESTDTKPTCKAALGRESISNEHSITVCVV